ncbi:MAG: helix-turn-helix domain-containing protein [Chloroflexi bacterium]|nr:helix-turn-helix domain-containing protein [Chloroflexota bacterium]
MTRRTRAKNWLTVGQVGQYCLVSTATVRRWIQNGELSAIRLPSGHYRVRLADFKDFLKRHGMPVREELEIQEMSETEIRFFEAVMDNPRGVTLREMAEKVGIAPIVAGRSVRNLLDAGKIRKEDNHYYVMNSGATKQD